MPNHIKIRESLSSQQVAGHDLSIEEFGIDFASVEKLRPRIAEGVKTNVSIGKT